MQVSRFKEPQGKNCPDATKKSYREAITWENETREELLEQLSKTNSESLLIGNWTNEYLAEAHNRFTHKTFKEKKAAFARLFKSSKLKPDHHVEVLTISVCRKFLNNQFENRSGYAANKDRKNLGTAWNWGRENIDGWPKLQNPFLSVKKFPEKRKPRYVPPEQDFWKVFEISECQDQLMLLSFFDLAARRGEIFNLKWSDVDFANNRIRLWTKKREGGNQEFDWLPMISELREGLLSWWEKRLAIPGIDKDYVFVCLDRTAFCDPYYGKPFTTRQHFMKRLFDKAGVKPFGFHAIRHLTASILYQKGYSVALIQAILRHKNPNTTTRYLWKLGLEQVREALEEGLKGPAKVLSFQRQADHI